MYICKSCNEEIETTKIPISKLCICCFYKRQRHIDKYEEKVCNLWRRLDDMERQYRSFDPYKNDLLGMKYSADCLIKGFENCAKLYSKLLGKYDKKCDLTGSVYRSLDHCYIMIKRNLKNKIIVEEL